MVDPSKKIGPFLIFDPGKRPPQVHFEPVPRVKSSTDVREDLHQREVDSHMAFAFMRGEAVRLTRLLNGKS